MRPTAIVIVVVLAGAGAFLWTARDDSRADEVRSYLVEGTRLESEGAFGQAIQVYRQALDEESELVLEAAERAELRYRLANALILGNNLNGGLGMLQEMIQEDVSEHRIDLTPLCMELGDRAMDAGDRRLAQIAYRLGESLSVTASRLTDFREKLEPFIRAPGGDGG